MGTVDRITSFLELAEEELTAARTLLDTQLFRQAAYQCQQCAEKVARALLEHAGIPFGTGHNLGQMASSLDNGHPFRDRIMKLDILSAAATRYRYPGPTGRLALPPSEKELRNYLAILRELLDSARKFVS